MLSQELRDSSVPRPAPVDLAEILVCEEDAGNNAVQNHEFFEPLLLFVAENPMVDTEGFIIPRSPISIDCPLFLPLVDSLATIADFSDETRGRLSTALREFVGENIFEVASEAGVVELPMTLEDTSSEGCIGQTAGREAAASASLGPSHYGGRKVTQCFPKKSPGETVMFVEKGGNIKFRTFETSGRNEEFVAQIHSVLGDDGILIRSVDDS
jgi:hypothetical protein